MQNNEGYEGKYAPNKYSWQKPNGDFIPVKDTHHTDAIKNKIVLPTIKDPIMEAWKRGYNRIHYYGKDLYVHNEVHSPNVDQVRKLIRLAMDSEVERIIYDSGNNEKILWSIHDTLE